MRKRSADKACLGHIFAELVCRSTNISDKLYCHYYCYHDHYNQYSYNHIHVFNNISDEKEEEQDDDDDDKQCVDQSTNVSDEDDDDSVIPEFR